MKRANFLVSLGVLACVLCLASFAPAAGGQAVTASLGGKVLDTSGGTVAKATITITNTATRFSRSVQSSDTGDYLIPALPAGEYAVGVELTGFKKQTRSVTLQVGQAATLDFTLAPGQVEEKMVVEANAEVAEPTRTQVSTVITERQIVNLPVNGREFIDFALLSPAVQIGDTTSGSTDVIVEPVTKLSFAGQNIHYNFIAVDGADDVSTASGIQRGTPPQESVQEFRVVNTDYSVEFGRAVGGIVNIITRSGTNNWHGTLYEYFRNNVLDATNILQATGAHVLRQNQFGGAIGGPVRKDKMFLYANYELQRRGESPIYNSIVLGNIGLINGLKRGFGLPVEPNLNSVLRTNNTDDGFVRLDHNFNEKHILYTRYFINDGRLTNQSPLNDGFDLPSGFKNNFYRDQSVVGGLTSVFSPKLVNEVRMQFARRSFGFPTVSSQPHLEVLNTFTMGVNRGNPDSYRESRFELVDNVTLSRDRHTFSFGGNFNHVNTTESFPLFYPFEADFGCFLASQCPFSLQAGSPEVIFFERFQAPTFTEHTLNPTVFQGGALPSAITTQATGVMGHTYNGLYIQDKWRPTDRLTLNGGIRWEWETWPSKALNTQWKNVDPRLGLAYNIGTPRHVVLRAGFGLFHGIIPAPLIACQIPSCGGTAGPYPTRPQGDALNAVTRLFAFASAPNITSIALSDILGGTYPDAAPLGICPGGTVSGCGFFGDSVIVRFDQNHQNPYGVQASLGFELEPFKDSVLNISFLRSKGVHLGSFFNINQPNPSGQALVHNSNGTAGLKNTYFAAPGIPGSRSAAPGFPVLYAVYFEAASRWNSEWNGLLINFNKRMSHHFSTGFSYTWSKGIDDGPNPSFVLIPQDSQNLKAERALSADDVRHRFVANATAETPHTWNAGGRDFQMGLILTLQSPQYFTKFAGFDANGDIFGNNDRVGIEPRNTFRGDSLQTVDLRLSRTFDIHENQKVQLIAEAFNLLNTVNVRFFNTVYGAADFCPFNPAAQGCTAQRFLEGSPNPNYGTPRSTFNPRQIQFAFRYTF
ncbi:MAG TPA: carboxypeptidase regulatory-like domain-containing protein [Candidatus Acidoferrales bacterium]|nr:carboxypeptidase regulatory-like domain-containing protein [Candidatus Acidoferrales bacterium]